MVRSGLDGLTFRAFTMRLSIRNQILIPLFAVQVVTVTTIAVVAVRQAARRVEIQVMGRLEGVVETLGQSNFPLTSPVLEKMRGLSGAHFIASDRDGRVLESTLPGLSSLAPELRGLPDRARVEFSGSSTTVRIKSELYFANSIRSPGGSNLLILYPEINWRNARWEAGLPTIVLGILSLLPMGLMTGAVAHRLSLRLRSVETKVASIAGGDLRELETTFLGDEVDELIGSVNSMARQIRSLRATIQRTERAGILAQLAAGLAHQLRNSATGARMAIQLHRRRCATDSSEASLEVALRQLALCESQIRSLLRVGQSSPSDRTMIDPSDLIEEALRLVEPACGHAGIQLTHQVSTRQPFTGDLDQLRSALLNLLLNAVDAAGPGGAVGVFAEDDGEFFRTDVVDSGPGPPPELEHGIFEPFVTGKPEGIGLGLDFAKRVALEHRGELSWTRAEGRTTFSMKIARNRPRERQEDEPSPGDR